MILSRDMTNFEPELHRFQFKIQESWVGKLRQFLSVTKYSKKRFMIYTECEIGKTQNEELALVKPDHRGQSFSLDRVVTGLSS